MTRVPPISLYPTSIVQPVNLSAYFIGVDIAAAVWDNPCMDKAMAKSMLTMRAHHHSWGDIHMRFSQSYSNPQRAREALRDFGRKRGWDIDWAFPLTNRGRSISLEVPPDWKERIK